MKKILILSVLLAGGLVWWFVQSAKTPSHFGAAFAAETPLVQMQAAYSDTDRYLSGPIMMQGKITRQCPSSGCWFYLDDASGKQVKIELGHMGIKFPQWVGKNAKIEGRLLKNKEDLELVGTAAEFF